MILATPRRAVTLWDMMMFCIHEFAMRWNRIEACLAHVQLLASGEKGNKPLQPKDFIVLQPTVNDLNYIATTLILDKSMHQLGQLEDALSGKPCNFHMLDNLLESIMRTIKLETDEVMLAFIPHEKQEFFEVDDLFGKAVSSAFPSAKADIKNAGNAVASSLEDAAIFYLCRIAEHGLRALAKKLKVKLKYPLEYADWGTVCGQIEIKLIALRSKRRGKKRERNVEFFSNMLSDCKVIKEAWRDCVMHTRKSFNESEALGAYKRVFDFMNQLVKNGIAE